jgi:hypothetical protein
MTGLDENKGQLAKRPLRRWVPWMWLLLVAMACNLTGGAAAPTPTALAGFPVTYAPIVTMTSAVPTSQATPDPGTPAESRSAVTEYKVDATINALTHVVTVSMRALYRNRTGQPLDQIVFNIDPNRTPGTFRLDDLRTADPAPVGISQHTLNGPRLEITLDSPLEPDSQIAFSLSFTIKVLALQDARMRYLSYTERQINLGFWLPEVAPFIKGEWRTPRAWSVGEYTYEDMADFEVRATVQGKPNMEIIGPGEVTRIDNSTWEFVFHEGRSFALAVSNAMALMSTQTADGVTIDLYYFVNGQPTTSPDGQPISGPQHALNTAREAVELYTKRFGAIPYTRLVIVDGDFPDGMELSGMVYVGHQWFAGYKGKLDSWLTLITAHEVSHQWWYVLVNDDQGETPYLDEALAIYCEVFYLEQKAPNLIAWWWDFRVRQYQPKGFVDSTVYDYWNSRLYINAIYLRGASMLQEIRDLIGDDAFSAWLIRYFAAEKNKIATPADFWGALTPADYERTAEIRARYLSVADPLNPPTATPQATGTP